MSDVGADMPCAECGAAVADGAVWCGSCGALLADQRHLPAPADGPAAPPAPRRSRVAAGVAVLLGVAVTAALLGDPEPGATAPVADSVAPGEVVPPALPPDPTAAAAASSRVFAREGSVVWTRTDVPPAGPDADVVPIGDAHVLVGDRVVPTGGAARALLALPAPVRGSAVTGDGRWAAGDRGRVVLGWVERADTTAVAPAGDWVPVGGAVAWAGDDPVLLGEDGTLARVADDGALVWRSPATLRPTVVGGDWVAAQRADGGAVAVALADGRTVELPGAPLALVGDTAVLLGDDVLGHALASGSTRWRREDTGRTWTVVDGALVAVGAAEAERVDPRTGRTTGSVLGFAPVPSASGAVVQQQGVLRATAWDGTALWTRALDPLATHAVVTVDADRVAVRSETGDGTRVTVLDAADGEVLTVAPAAPAAGALLAADGVVATVGAGQPVLVDAVTGQDVQGPAPAAAPGGLGVGEGADRIEVEVGLTGLRGLAADAPVWTTDFGVPLASTPVPSGTSLVVPLVDGTVAALDVRSGQTWWRRDLGVLLTAVGGDGTQLLVGTADGRVLRLDPDGAPVTSVTAGSGAVRAVVPGQPAVALLADRLVGIDVSG